MQTLYKNANAVVGLERLYARLKGELKRIDRESANVASEAQRALASLSAERAFRLEQMEKTGATLRLLEPDVALDSIAPVTTRTRTSRLRHGDVRREILAILREHDRWMSAVEIHEMLLTRNGIVFADREQKRMHLQKLREALHALANFDPPRLEREHDLKPGSFAIVQRWRLSAMFRD